MPKNFFTFLNFIYLCFFTFFVDRYNDGMKKFAILKSENNI